MSSNLFKKRLLVSSMAVVLGSSLSIPTFAADDAADEGETVVITGIRGSLKEALNKKRFSNAVVDSISAEDIGKFPDRNIAESLQRIPGVAISRNFAGEGGSVSIRGTNPELTLVTMNGNAVSSTGWFSQGRARRSFDMDLLPPEIVAGVDVYKSPMASLDEGGVGGTVSIRTRKPLDLDPNTVFLSAETQNNSISDGSGSGFTGMYSWKNDQDTFGAMISYSTLETVGRAHKAENYMDDGWAGAGIAEFNQTRQRDVIDFTIEFSPSDSVSMNLHVLDIDLDANNTNQNYLIIAGGLDDDLNGDGVITGAEVGYNRDAFNASVSGTTDFGPTKGFALNGTRTGGPSDDTNSRNAAMDSKVVAYEINIEQDSYTVNAKIGKSEASGGDGGNYNAGWKSNNANQSIIFDMRGDDAMLLQPVNTDASNHSEYVWDAGSVTAQYRFDEETFAQADLDHEVEWGPVSNIKAGLKVRDHEFKTYSDKWAFDATFGDNITKESFADGTFDHSGVGLLAGSPTDIARINGDQLRAYYDAHKTTETRQNNTFGLIQEDITAAYVQADFSGDDFAGNVGIRYVQTDVSADYYVVNDLVTENSDYVDWLPSFNISINLSDDVILRGSAAKVISRPNYSFMNPAASVNTVTQTITRGSVALDPYRATQSDIGVEWYFNDESLFSVTLFNKDIRSFIAPGANTSTEVVGGVAYQSITPGQGLGGQIEGAEIQYQQQLGDFGWSANMTFADGYGLQEVNGQVTELPLAGMSDFSYNLSAYYENDVVSTRLAYTFREDFIAESTGIGGNTSWDAHGFLDANVTWHATENLDVSLEATNITEESTTQRFATGFKAMRLAAQNGRNIYFKVSYRM